MTARRENGGATLEFVASPSESNLQDRLAVLGETGATDAVEQEVSRRLLRHLPSVPPTGGDTMA